MSLPFRFWPVIICLLLSSTVNSDKVVAWIGKGRSSSDSKDITADDVGTQHSAWISTHSENSYDSSNSISGDINYMGGGSSRNRNRIRSIWAAEARAIGITSEAVPQTFLRDGGRRIIGGRPATGTYRWVTKIEKLGGSLITCVGNLISERWIVTAAHCILNGQNTGYKSAATPGNTKITYGCLNTESASCKTADAVRYIAHPCYTPSDDQDHDDIALIELRAPVEGMAGQFAWVNGLNGSISIGDGEDVILAGFGATQQNGGGQTKVLMEVTVAKRPTSICEKQNPSAVRKQYVNYNNVICTGGTRGKDSCNGDSGGPAIVVRDGKPWLVGVLSIGSELPETDKSCGAEGRIAVYTSVEKYSNWIYAVMNNKDFCCRECPVIATRNPPYLACTGPPLAPATSCVGAEGAVSSLVAGPTDTYASASSWQVVLVGVLAGALVLCCLLAAFWYYLRRQRNGRAAASAASYTGGHIEMGHLPPSIDADGSTLVQQQTPAEHIPPPPPPRPPLHQEAGRNDADVPAIFEEAEEDFRRVLRQAGSPLSSMGCGASPKEAQHALPELCASPPPPRA